MSARLPGNRHARPGQVRAAPRGAALTALPYLLVAAATLLLGLPTLIMPLHPDQALFAMVGRTVAHGGFPYLDAWDFKPPLLYLLYAAAVGGPFDVTENVRAFDLCWTAATAVLIFELGRRWWSPRAGLIAALTFALIWSTGTPWWQSAQPDSFVVLPLALALLLVEVSRGRGAWLVLAGLCLGLAFQLRFNVALLLPVLPFVEVLGAPRGHRVRTWLRFIAWMLAGFLVAQGIVVLYLAVGHAFGEYIAAMRFAAGYTRQGGPFNTAEGPSLGTYATALRTAFWNWAGFRLVLSIPAMAAGCYGALVLRERRIQQLALLTALAYAGIAAQAKFFWYHYGYVVPFMALICGWGWDRLLAALRRYQAAPWAVMTAMLLAAALVLASPEVWDTGLAQWRGLISYVRAPEGREQHRANAFYFYAPEAEVARYLRERTRPDETIYVWGFDPLIYLLADRASASRFLLSFPLMSDWAPRHWHEQFITELKERKPAYIVVERGQAGNWIVGHNIGIDEYVQQFPSFRQLLDEEYKFEADVGGAMLFRRRAD